MTSYRLTRNLVDQFPRFATNGGSATGSYSANAVLKRNDLSAGFSPAQLPNCVLWLRADLGTVPGNTLAGWTDQSGNGNSLPALNPAQIGTVTAGAGPLASLPALVVTSPPQVYKISNALVGTKNFTIAVVGKSTGNATWCETGISTNGFAIGIGSGARTFNANGNVAITDTTSSYTNNTWEAWVFNSDASSNLSLTVNGVAHTLSPSNATALSQTAVFSVAGTAYGDMTGDLWEVIVYSQKLTAAQLALLTAYQLNTTGL